MIGNSNISLGPAFVIQEDYAVKSQQAAALTRSNSGTNAAASNSIQQQTGENVHDKQEQQPQDAEPEPAIDNNDLNQV